MSPVGDEASPIKHFGHASDETSYTSKGHTFFLNCEMYPTQKASLYIKGSYTIAKGDYDSIHLKLPDEYLEDGDYDFSEVNQYSDIDQSYYEVATGGTFDFTKSVGMFVGFEYAKFKDDEPWVYGDQTGDWYNVNMGVTVSL